MTPKVTCRGPQILLNLEPKRDGYGFTVRPQHLHRYREYTDIYKEEEEERLEKWKCFLEQQSESASEHLLKEENLGPVVSEVSKPSTKPSDEVSGVEDGATEQKPSGSIISEDQAKLVEEDSVQGKDSSETRLIYDTPVESVATKEAPVIQHAKSREVQSWAAIRPSLNLIESMMSARIKKSKNMKDEKTRHAINDLPVIDEVNPSKEQSDDEDEDVFYDNEIVDDSAAASAAENDPNDKISREPSFPWKELEFLVRGGVPKDLRGEVWQAFVGVRTRRVESYYQDLLATETEAGDGQETDKLLSGDDRKDQHVKSFDLPEKWKKQIEKVIRCMGPGIYRSIFLIRSPTNISRSSCAKQEGQKLTEACPVGICAT